MNPTLFNIQHFSIQDGPGIRTTLFFKGCPLDCSWCHNPEGKSIKPVLSLLASRCVYCKKCLAVCPNVAHVFEGDKHTVDRAKCIGCGKCAEGCCFGALELFGREYSVDEILEDIAKDAAFYGDKGGVTISGGEPFTQFESLITLLKILKQKGYNICLETSGFTSCEKITETAKYVDVFLYDYKESDAARHYKFTGVKQDNILANLWALDEIGADVILRCPIIPEINDYEEHYKGIANIANVHTSIMSVELMPYHPLGIAKSENIGAECDYKNAEFFDKNKAETICEIIRKFTDKPVSVSK